MFNDSLTTLGNYQPQASRTWLNTPLPWIKCNFNWLNQPASIPAIVGGNQQGFVEYLDELTVNDVSLYISNITGNVTTPTVITSPNHNMQTGFVIGIIGIPSGTPYDTLNDGVYGIVMVDSNNFEIYSYDPLTQQFSIPVLNDPGTYVGLGYINIRENFSITSKKFNFLDEGQSIQMGYIDILMPSISGSISISGSPGSTDIDGNFLGDLADIFLLPETSSIIPGSFSATVADLEFTETYPPSNNLLLDGSPAPIGSFITHSTTEIGLVTGMPVTGVNVSFNYDPGTPLAEISMNVYLDYNDDNPSNTLPYNAIAETEVPDTFFNSVIPTSQSLLNQVGGTKFWQRIYCPTRANFLTIQYTFSNAQMAYAAQEMDVQIDAQVVWIRKAGRMTQI